MNQAAATASLANPEKFVLNPKGNVISRLQFDALQGYDALLLDALQTGNYGQERILDPLLHYGYENVTACSPEAARQLWAYKGAQFYDRPFDKSHLVLSQQHLIELLGTLLVGALDAKLKNYFFTNYAILFCTFMETYPNADAVDGNDTNVSMGWHCDGGPSCLIKLLLYVNDSTEHHGGTEVVDRYTTDLFKKIGYVACPVEHRKIDLQPLAERYRIPYRPELMQPAAGQGLLFEPSNIMHRGSRPTAGVRRILQLGIIPWAEGWRHFLQRTGEFVWKNEAGIPDVTRK